MPQSMTFVEKSSVTSYVKPDGRFLPCLFCMSYVIEENVLKSVTWLEIITAQWISDLCRQVSH